jgi:UDP-N-acetylmuramoyl-L-alanyl-D-glutamate--2,6-diaminopimelate ligase
MLKKFKGIIGSRSPIRLAWHAAKAFIAAVCYGFPARNLIVIGITGTDGKTTTVGMLTHILHSNGCLVGAASTAFFQVNDDFIENSSHLTSMSPFALQKFLQKLVRTGCTHAVIENSSHGLVQSRTSWTFPAVAAITNTSLEHLDYHGSMEQYREDKGILFRMLRGKGTKVLNAQDDTALLYSKIPSMQTLTFSTVSVEADLCAQSIIATANRLSVALSTKDTFTLHVSGIYNAENALCAISCASACGIPIQKSCDALQTFPGIPGRMEKIDEGQPFNVYVDFCVSPRSYEKTLLSLREIVGDSSRVLVLCSSCGNRMKEKRPLIGTVCSQLADVVVVAEDETYGEDPHSVLEEVWQGVNTSLCDAHKIFDRKEAIEFLFKSAKPGDAVVLCGMGPFSTMNTMNGPIDWDERKIARALLRDLV